MAVAAVMMVAGCATMRESRVNPFNWFGGAERSETTQAAPVSGAARTDGRVLVAQLGSLHLERTSDGAILRVTGVPASQGWYQPVLELSGDSTDTALVYDFVLKEPAVARPGQPQSREITVATFISGAKLERVSSLTVRGADNALTSRR